MSVANDLERYMLQLVNMERVANGLDVLRLELNLNASAEAHSAWMSDADSFSHTGVNGSSAHQRMELAGMNFSGTWSSAENLAAVPVNGAASYYDEVDALHRNLMDSKVHRDNILDPDLQYIGIGITFGPMTYSSGSHPSVIVTQNFALTAGNPDLDLAGGDTADRIAGEAGDDHLDGRAGADVLMGMDGRDTLVGGAGHDVLFGGDRGLYGADVSAQVFRLYNAVLGRDPDGAGHQGWALQLATGEMDLGTMAGRFMASAEFQRVYGAVTDDAFVTLLYNNVLGRDPDAAGFDVWMQRITEGMPREEVVTRFSESAEHQRLTATDLTGFEAAQDPTVFGPQIYRLYLAVLGREADVAGFESWMNRVEDGMAMYQVATSFMASREFQATYGTLTDDAFVTQLYDNVLGREPDTASFDVWMQRLADGMPREEVVTRFAESREFRANTAADLKAFMLALGPDDVLEPGAGGSVLSGGAGSDTFVFGATDDGRHAVTDLEPWDRLDLTGFGYAGIAEARAQITQVEADAVFSDQGVTIVFLDTQAGTITADMILV